jgi:hypothetical protein
MGIKGNGKGLPNVPHHKPPKTLSNNIQNHKDHQKRSNLMEIDKNGRGCTRWTLHKTQKTTKQKPPKEAKR